MRLRDILARPELHLTLLTGEEHLDRPVRLVYTTDLLDPGRYLTGGEIVLTGLMWRRTPADSEAFVSSLVAAEVAALGAGDAALGSVPPDLLDACRKHGLPLFEVPVDVSFRTIADEVIPALWSARATGLAAVLGRQRGLVSAVADGAGLDKLLPLMTSDLGVACWVLTPSGRVVAGTEPLAPADAARLARAFLAADRLPRQATLKPDRPVTLVAVNSRAHRLAGWFLACEGAHGSDQARGPYPAGGSDPARGPDSAVELAALVALERARLEEGRRVERRLAAQLLALLASDTADPAQLAPRLVSCGIAPDEVCVALVATISGAGPDLARAVLEEIVPPQAAVAEVGDEALALVPTPPDGGSELVERIRAVAGSLAPGLAPGPDGGRLALGISDPAVGAGALHGAVEEARHAHRLAAVRARAAASGPRVVVVPAGELASHVLLLAAVPDETRRSFRQRLLGPLLDYDRTHAADLVATLEVFLAGSGSWTRSAEQLHVHVNTLRYRIRRIQELTGRDLGRLEDRVDFFLALRL